MRSYTTYSDFLNMDEQSTLASTGLPCLKYGGYPGAERTVAAFGDNAREGEFPIAILKISPVAEKFADSLTHRDFLGGLMNLGIKRELIGDIIVDGNNGYIFCIDKISAYIADNLNRIKHTTVSVSRVDSLPGTAADSGESAEIIIPSLRLDAVIRAVYKLSRRGGAELILKEKVFVNSRTAENTSYLLREGDIVSVRKMGRFVFNGTVRETKKQRLVAQIQIYR